VVGAFEREEIRAGDKGREPAATREGDEHIVAALHDQRWHVDGPGRCFDAIFDHAGEVVDSTCWRRGRALHLDEVVEVGRINAGSEEELGETGRFDRPLTDVDR
jgi:hypothetical protein